MKKLTANQTASVRFHKAFDTNNTVEFQYVDADGNITEIDSENVYENRDINAATIWTDSGKEFFRYNGKSWKYAGSKF